MTCSVVIMLTNIAIEIRSWVNKNYIYYITYKHLSIDLNII